MTSPLSEGAFVEYGSVLSTQDLAIADVKSGGTAGVIFAVDQTKGRGRFDREWISAPGDSLTMSLIFRSYADHPAPHLIGMALAIAAASAIQSQIRWPNDLTIHGKKAGGILTELISDPHGKLIPVVGIGINLNQNKFPPPIDALATSLFLETKVQHQPKEVAQSILKMLASIPEPNTWSDLSLAWTDLDDTPGKRYKLFSGEEAVAVAVGPDAALLCTINGQSNTIFAAEALFH